MFVESVCILTYTEFEFGCKNELMMTWIYVSFASESQQSSVFSSPSRKEYILKSQREHRIESLPEGLWQKLEDRGSNPDEVIGFLSLPTLMGLGLTQPGTETSTRNLLRG
jgi:hypothetical protein